jgi:hypothetical protein
MIFYESLKCISRTRKRNEVEEEIIHLILSIEESVQRSENNK